LDERADGGAMTMVALDDVARKLAEDHIGIAKSVALSMAGTMPPEDLDDLIGVTLLGLVRAAARFDDRGVPFSSYAYPVVLGLARNACAAPRRRWWELKGWDVAAEPDAVDPEDMEELPRHLGQLSGRERRVVDLRFGLADGRERSLSEVGEELGHSKQYAHQVLSGAIRKLRRMYGVPVLQRERKAG
jgi:RNA polymerase sigma factor (sigma-70 family)